MEDPGGLAPFGGWATVLGRVIAGERLTVEVASAVMDEVFAGRATTPQLAGLLCVLRARGETVDELLGFTRSMYAAATPLPGLTEDLRDRLVDTCGTGGDRSGTINVSTTAALVVAGAGVPVCKHGNRAASSQTGSAEVLSQLGVEVDLPPEGVEACIEEAGIGFCLAPRFHPAMRYAGPIRKELGVPTAFNLMGPLTNPARVRRQVIGVSDPRYAAVVLGVLRERGAARAMVVHGDDGIDELTLTTTSHIHELRDGEVETHVVDPEELGFALVPPEALRGGDPARNAECVRRILEGEPGPQADVVILNAAAALVVGDAVDDLPSGVELARASITEGRAARALEQLVASSVRAATMVGAV